MYKNLELLFLVFCLIVNLFFNYIKPDILNLLGVLFLSLVIGLDLGMKIVEKEYLDKESI